jgi:sulfite reductase beta subunit-like hemoprotein
MNERSDSSSILAGASRQTPTSRLLGVYPQKQPGLFMQRIKILGGRISWPQWRQVAHLAERYSAGFTLHITTRQDIELHNIIEKNLAVVQQGLAGVGLTTVGACGDTARNITVCTACDFCPDGLDVLPIAHLVRNHLEQHPAIFSLPRKFKISFSGCQKSCAKPYVNDLAFVAQPDGLFTVIGAGSLGPRPSLGIRLYKDLSSSDILPLCVASVEFFTQYGDRDNRHRARLRHVREKFGDQTFKTMLDERLNHVRTRQQWPQPSPAQGRQNANLLHRLQLPGGNITCRQAVDIADAAEPEGAALRINLEHGIELYGGQSFHLPHGLSALADGPTVVACPGSAACSKGLCDCRLVAERIRKVLLDCNLTDVRINISGCPNNCARSAVADIGLVGILRKENGQSAQHYRLLVGGGNGISDKLAQEISVLHTENVPDAIRTLLKKNDKKSL